MLSIEKTSDGNYAIHFSQNDLPVNSTPIPPVPPVYIPDPIDLTNWKITLPTGSKDNPMEVLQPQLNNFLYSPYFVPAGNGITFQAPVNGVTTSGSSYPRSELREMTNGGKDQASWSSSTGTHQMVVECAITHLPLKKKEVVVGQIHNSSDDICVFRLEDTKLYFNVNGKNTKLLTDSYVLGTSIRIGFYVEKDQTTAYYNKVAVSILSKKYSGAYFKMGMYTQSNCQTEDVCAATNFGECIVTKLEITHT